MKLKDVPWRIIRKTFYYYRRLLFTVDHGSDPIVLPNTSIDELREILRKEHFANGRFFSYSYKGEDLNVFRAEYKDDEYGDYQTHIRAFSYEDEPKASICGISPHVELDPRSDGQAKDHLESVHLSVSEGIKEVKGILNRHDVSYRVEEVDDG